MTVRFVVIWWRKSRLRRCLKKTSGKVCFNSSRYKVEYIIGKLEMCSTRSWRTNQHQFYEQKPIFEKAGRERYSIFAHFYGHPLLPSHFFFIFLFPLPPPPLPPQTIGPWQEPWLCCCNLLLLSSSYITCGECTKKGHRCANLLVGQD